MDGKKRSQEITITFSELVSFVKQHLKFVCKWSYVLGGFILLVALFSPLKYTYEVKIKVPDNKIGSEGGLKDMIPLFGQSSAAEGAVTLLESHILLRQVIEKMGLQVRCHSDSFFKRLFISCQQSLLFGIHKESFFDRDLFSFRDVAFSGERPLDLLLRCLPDGSYELLENPSKVLGRALLGESLNFSLGHLVLEGLPRNIEFGKLYSCRLNPLSQEISYWKGRAQIKMAKFDKTILDFRMIDKDRHRGKRFLDLLLVGYQEWKQQDQNRIYDQQLAYLRQKTEEITESFRAELVQHRKYLQESLARYGTLGYTEEIESLMQSKHGYKAQLLEIALDLKRVEEIERDEQKRGAVATFVSNNKEDLGRSPSVYPYPTQAVIDPSVEEAANELPLQELAKFNSKIIAECLTNCVREQERLEEEKEKLSLLLQGMESSEFEISSLSSVFADQTVQNLLLKVQALSLQMKDRDNLSVREQERLQEMMVSYRGSLLQQLSQTINLKQGQIDALQNKILHWRSVWKEVLTSEKRLLQEQLSEITQSMSALPDKWYYETLLEMRQEQCQESLKGLEQMRFAVHATLQPVVYPLQVLDGDFVSNKASSFPFWQQAGIGFILVFFGLYFALFMRYIFTMPAEVVRHD